MNKVCVITGSRAEFGLLSKMMKEIQNDSTMKLQIIATGQHLSEKFGLTYKDIEADGFTINEKVSIDLNDDSSIGVSKALSQAVLNIAVALDKLKPDLIVILGDRYEIFAASIAATISRIPIAHIHGGESTVGAFDESLRHAITKMALFHFPAASVYAQRIIQMGESPKRVFCLGAPGLDHIKEMNFLTKDQLEKELNIKLKTPTFLITMHPATLENNQSVEIQNLLDALSLWPHATFLFTGTNADPDNNMFTQKITEFVKSHSNSKLFTSLGTFKYLNTLKHSDVVIGNSSSGLIEAPALSVPTVNIGNRQKGRLLASSVVSCSTNKDEITKAIQKVLSDDFRKTLTSINNPYDSHQNASLAIKNKIKEIQFNKEDLKKEFYDLSF